MADKVYPIAINGANYEVSVNAGVASSGIDPNAIHVGVASEIDGITAKATPIQGDIVAIEDSADSNNKKKVDLADIAHTSTVLFKGSGDPEGVVTAPIGSLYQRTDGGVGSVLYTKETGDGLNTGWSPVTGGNSVIKGTLWNAMGERENAGTTSTGEDIWLGTATSIPTPADAGEQMYVVSSSANDTSAGSGVRTIQVNYLDATGNEQTTTVIMNGTTGVRIDPTNARFINDMYTLTVGSNGVAAGDITIYKTGETSTIYNMIALGGNKPLVPHRMVPYGKQLRLVAWHGGCAAADEVSIRIRSTDMNGVLIPGVFCFKGSAFLYRGVTGQLDLGMTVPALSIVKVSAWPVTSGGEFSCGWTGDLTDA